jgi:putative transposase
MAVPKRHASIPGTYFVTSRTWESRPIFKTAPPCEIFIEWLLHYRDQGSYRLHGFVVMPDHFHMLLTPAGTIALERAVQFVKGGSSHALRERLLYKFPIWQRGFSDRRIRDASDCEQHVRYLAANPVKKHLSVSAAEYPWSSASGTFCLDEIPQGLKPLNKAS